MRVLSPTSPRRNYATIHSRSGIPGGLALLQPVASDVVAGTFRERGVEPTVYPVVFNIGINHHFAQVECFDRTATIDCLRGVKLAQPFSGLAQALDAIGEAINIGVMLAQNGTDLIQ